MKWYQGMLLIGLLLSGMPSRAEQINTGPTNISVKPQRCIALHQGQTCYQKLTFKITTPMQGEFCLYRSTSPSPLICWVGASLNKYIYKFKSAESEQFEIKDKLTGSILGAQEVRVAWVYKSKKKVPSGWRLF